MRFTRASRCRKMDTALPCEDGGVEKFAIVIHQEPEGGFWAEVPALPGCYSQGETIEDLKANVREAIEGDKA